MDKIYLTVEIPIEIEIIGVHEEEKRSRDNPGSRFEVEYNFELVDDSKKILIDRIPGKLKHFIMDQINVEVENKVLEMIKESEQEAAIENAA